MKLPAVWAIFVARSNIDLIEAIRLIQQDALESAAVICDNVPGPAAVVCATQIRAAKPTPAPTSTMALTNYNSGIAKLTAAEQAALGLL